MGNDTTDLWGWVGRDTYRLRKEGGSKQAIVDGYNDFWEHFHRDSAAADMAISGAIEAARATGEIRWELHLRHWRLQLWLRQRELKRMLPEAIDLLTLATDERVRDVPQRICAYHDVVECYVEMDAVGYYDEIIANSQEILAQVPQRHPCATCARSHIAQAAAAAGRVEEAKRWRNLCEANLKQPKYAELLTNFALMCELLSQWDDAERYYLEAHNTASRNRENDSFLEATLGIVRARVAKGDLQGAVGMLHIARKRMKYHNGTSLLARLLEVEGYFATALNEPQTAVDYFTRSARQYLDLGCYRDAALTSLHAAELAKELGLSRSEDALLIEGQAVGRMLPTSRDVYNRLAALGSQPAPPTTAQSTNIDETISQDARDKSELIALNDLLQAHIANRNLQGVITMLYRLGRWHHKHGEHRAAVDYFIWNAILERFLKLSMAERKDTLGILKRLRKQLPHGSVDAALAATESGPPSWLSPLLSDISTGRWRWLVRSVATEVSGQPVVEPEPAETAARDNFNEWMIHTAGMVSLIVRFQDQADPAQCERWAATLDEIASSSEQHAGPEGQGREFASLVRGLAALSRGASIEEANALVLTPYNQVIEQIGIVAKQPVWLHPGSSPLDFLVEQATQKAVTALRTDDEHRSQRLANLAFRYQLMTIDIRKRKELQPIARFLEALGTLVLAGGAQLPFMEPPLEAPFASMLAAVYETSKAGPQEKDTV